MAIQVANERKPSASVDTAEVISCTGKLQGNKKNITQSFCKREGVEKNIPCPVGEIQKNSISRIDVNILRDELMFNSVSNICWQIKTNKTNWRFKFIHNSY